MFYYKICIINYIFITGFRNILTSKVIPRNMINDNNGSIVFGKSCASNGTCPSQLLCDPLTLRCLCSPPSLQPLLFSNGVLVCHQGTSVGYLCTAHCSPTALCEFSPAHNLTLCHCKDSCTLIGPLAVKNVSRPGTVAAPHNVSRPAGLFFISSPQSTNLTDYLPALLTITFIFIVVFFVMGLPEYLRNMLLGLRIPQNRYLSRRSLTPDSRSLGTGRRSPRRVTSSRRTLQRLSPRPNPTATPQTAGDLIYCHLLLPLEERSAPVITAVHFVSRTSTTEERVSTPTSPPPNYYQLQLCPAPPPTYEEAMKLHPPPPAPE